MLLLGQNLTPHITRNWESLTKSRSVIGAQPKVNREPNHLTRKQLMKYIMTIFGF